MKLDLLRKELLEHLLSLRLLLAFLLVTVLMVASSVDFVFDHRVQHSDFDRQVNDNLSALSDNVAANIFQAFSFTRQTIYRQPSPLGFLAEGREKDLPNSFRLSAFRLEGPDYSLRGNPLLGDFQVLDWSFVVGTVLSFIAILLAGDGINGERERGTLRLLLANSVPRIRLLMTKYLAMMLLLALPLLLGGTVGLLIIVWSGGIALQPQDWAKIGSVLLISLLYLSIFVVLGLLLSSLLRHSQASLVVSLVLWVLLVIVVPSAGNLISQLAVKLPDQRSVWEQAGNAWNDAVEAHNRRYPHKDNWAMSGQWSPGEPLSRAMEAEEARARVLDRFEDQKIAQVELGLGLSRLSPLGLYQSATLSFAGTGFVHYRSFLDQARRYRQELGTFLKASYPFNPLYPQFERNVEISKLKVTFNAVPKFEEKLSRLRAGWSRAIWEAGLLAVLNVILFTGAWAALLRYDPR